MITLLAILKAGLAYVPLAPNWPEGRIRHVIEDSGPVLIITNQAATPAQRVSQLSYARNTQLKAFKVSLSVIYRPPISQRSHSERQ